MLDILSDVAGMAGAAMSGGLTGLLGTGLSLVTDIAQRRQAHSEEIELRRLDVELARVEAETAAAQAAAGIETARVEAGAADARTAAGVETARIEAWAAREAGELAALAASYREAARRWSRPGDGPMMRAVDVVRGLTRPVLTLLFVALTAAIYFSLADHEAGLRGEVIQTVLYLSVTCVIWWFGGRQLVKARAP